MRGSQHLRRTYNARPRFRQISRSARPRGLTITGWRWLAPAGAGWRWLAQGHRPLRHPASADGALGSWPSMTKPAAPTPGMRK